MVADFIFRLLLRKVLDAFGFPLPKRLGEEVVDVAVHQIPATNIGGEILEFQFPEQLCHPQLTTAFVGERDVAKRTANLIVEGALVFEVLG